MNHEALLYKSIFVFDCPNLLVVFSFDEFFQIQVFHDELEARRKQKEEADKQRLSELQNYLAEQAAYDRERFVCMVELCTKYSAISSINNSADKLYLGALVFDYLQTSACFRFLVARIKTCKAM